MTVKQRDACKDGFELDKIADAVFLDLPHPWDAISHFTNDSIITKPNITSVYTRFFLSLSVSVVWYCKFYHIKFRFLFCLSLAEKNWDIQWRFQRRLYGKYDTLDHRSTTLHNNGIPLWCIYLVIGLFDHIELTVEIFKTL